MNRNCIRKRLALALVLALAACATQSGPQPSAPAGKTASSITVTSKSLPSDSQIPVDYSCDGKDISPQLTWSAPPEGTGALVLIIDDPDASPTFTHWLVINLPASELSLAENVDPTSLGAKIGQNDFHSIRYNGPCPPRGESHQYRFLVYASDRLLPLNEGASRADVDAALAGHVLGAGSLVGTFGH